ncbi:hypothetical protein Efla_004870 [Eimeria flavescens]
MSLLDAAFASDTDSDDEDFEQTEKVGSSDSEEELDADAEAVAAAAADSSSSRQKKKEGQAPAAAKEAADTAEETEAQIRGGRKKWRLDLKRSRRKEKQQQRKQQRAAADAVYAELKQQHEAAIKNYPASVSADDVLLRFHRRQVRLRRPATAASVLQALRVHCSKMQPSSQAAAAAAAAAAAEAAAAAPPAAAASTCNTAAAGDADAAKATAAAAAAADFLPPEKLDVAALKKVRLPAAAAAVAAAATAAAVDCLLPVEVYVAFTILQRCRSAPSEELKDLIRNAVQEGAALSEKVVSKTVRFAGRDFQIEQRLSAAEFAAHEKAQQKQVKVRGDLEALEALDRALGGATSINSVQKSRADWSQFKEKAGLEEELKRGKGYLERQAFLANTTWAIHQQNVELRRQQQQAKQLQQQLQQPRPAAP